MPPLMTLKLARTLVGGTTMAGAAAGAPVPWLLVAGWDAGAPLAGAAAGGVLPVGPAPLAQAAASRRISRQPGTRRVMVVSPVPLLAPQAVEVAAGRELALEARLHEVLGLRVRRLGTRLGDLVDGGADPVRVDLQVGDHDLPLDLVGLAQRPLVLDLGVIGDDLEGEVGVCLVAVDPLGIGLEEAAVQVGLLLGLAPHGRDAGGDVLVVELRDVDDGMVAELFGHQVVGGDAAAGVDAALLDRGDAGAAGADGEVGDVLIGVDAAALERDARHQLAVGG